MDRLRASSVYIARGVYDEERTRERAERIAARIEAPTKRVVDDDEIERLQRGIPFEQLPRRGRAGNAEQARVIFLDRMRWPREDSVTPGYAWAELRNGRHEWERNRVVCQTAMEIQTVVGCAFDCSYCPYTTVLTLTCDLERFVERLDVLFEERPHQQIYKLNNRSDTLCFEPEYGLSKMLVERFARTSDRFLMLYSKSANVDHLVDLDHRGQTIACFTLSMPTTAKVLEPLAPPFEARLEAAAKCAAAGYPVRFRFSPIVPFAGFRGELRSMIRTMAEHVQPELVTLWTLSMIELEELDRIVDVGTLDEAALESAREAKMTGEKGAPFPESFRTEIYRLIADEMASASPKTRLSLCLESPEVITSLEDRLAIDGKQQVCNCGPRATPGKIAGAPSAADRRPRDRLRVLDAEEAERDARPALRASRRRR